MQRGKRGREGRGGLAPGTAVAAQMKGTAHMAAEGLQDGQVPACMSQVAQWAVVIEEPQTSITIDGTWIRIGNDFELFKRPGSGMDPLNRDFFTSNTEKRSFLIYAPRTKDNKKIDPEQKR